MQPATGTGAVDHSTTPETTFLHLFHLDRTPALDWNVTSPLARAQFDPAEYSRFKYGSNRAAEYYALLLSQLIFQKLWGPILRQEQVAIMGTPFKELPNAARILAVMTGLRLKTMGMRVSDATIRQDRLVAGDYSALSAEQRAQRNRGKTYIFDSQTVHNKHVVIIDDIRVTGSIVQAVLNLLQGQSVRSITVVSMIELDAELARQHPDTEFKLNHADVCDLVSLKRLMDDESDFRLITRAVKFILEQPAPAVTNLVRQLSSAQLANLWRGVISDGYDMMPQYRQTCAIITAANIT